MKQELLNICVMHVSLLPADISPHLLVVQVHLVAVIPRFQGQSCMLQASLNLRGGFPGCLVPDIGKLP